MREILFRGKRVDNGEWVYWNQFGEYTKPFFGKYEAHSHVSELDVVCETVCQYTGLKDKNGNKIFEGDLIQWSEMQHTSYDYDIEELATEDYEIEFVNGMFVAACLEQRFPTHELLTNFDLNEGKLAEIEIIGNIHDKEAE